MAQFYEPVPNVTEVYFSNLVFNRLIHVEDVCGAPRRRWRRHQPPALFFLQMKLLRE